MSNVDTPDYSSSSRSAGAQYLLFQGGATITPGNNFTTPALYAGAFETVTVKMQNSTPKLGSWFVAWYQDEALTELANAEQTYFTTNQVNNLVAFSVKAPYMIVRVINNDVANGVWGVTVQGVLSSSSQGDVFPPLVLADANFVPIGAGNTALIPVTLSLAGPAFLWGFANVAFQVGVRRWNGSAWMYLVAQNAGASASVTTSLILPGDDVRVEAANLSAGAGNYYFSLCHGG